MTESSKDYLYRILPFDRAVEILQGKLYFAHPRTWDDPYESDFQHSKTSKLFAQCWCKTALSDAMWRIYSKDNLSVRIRTTRTKLEAAIDGAMPWRGAERLIDDVQYLKIGELRKQREAIASELEATGFNVGTAARALFLKRDAFWHEDEVRVIVYDPKEGELKDRKGIQIDVDGMGLIDQIYTDPRAPKHLTGALHSYLTKEIGFTNKVRKSALYAIPAPRVIKEPDYNAMFDDAPIDE